MKLDFNRTPGSTHGFGALFRFIAALGVAASFALVGANATHAEPDAGVVGTGTPASCTEIALKSALMNGGTITFNCGGPATILVLSQQTISQPTTIDGGSVITLTAGLASKLFATQPSVPFILRNIVLDSAFSNSAHGAAINALGPLTLNNVTIQNSVAASSPDFGGKRYCGGAIFIAADATISNSTFRDNSANQGGGALCVRTRASDKVEIRNSAFAENRGAYGADVVEGYGGAIYADTSSKISVIDSAFTGNNARFGGAVYVGPLASLEMRGAPTTTLFSSKLSFINNDSTLGGGALYNTGVLSMSYALLYRNHVPIDKTLPNSGGAIYSEGILTLTNALLSQNLGDYGGGIYVGPKQAQAVIQRTSFIRNNSDELGGGLFAESISATVVISDSAFHHNTSRIFGGGLARVNAGLAIYNTSFTDNQSDRGAAMYVSASQAEATHQPIQSSTFGGNIASGNQGGGIYSDGASLALVNTTFYSNTHSIYSVNSGNIRLRNSVLHIAGTALHCTVVGAATITDDGNNYVTDASCDLPLSQNGLSLDPKLGPRTTDTASAMVWYSPLSDSPLIDKGTSCPARDQVGSARAGQCDIGAVEFGGTQATPTPAPGTTPEPTPTSTSAPNPMATPSPTTTNGYKVFVPLTMR